MQTIPFASGEVGIATEHLLWMGKTEAVTPHYFYRLTPVGLAKGRQ